MKTLIIAAHPDDEVLGCGGTIARLAASGDDVHIVIAGDGITSRYEHPENADSSLVQSLHATSKQVGTILGAKSVTLLRFPDNRFDTAPLLELVKKLEALIDELRPEAVYTQHGGDLNIDHQLVFRASLTATRPMAEASVKRLYAYPVGSSTEWAFDQFAPTFKPNSFVDISSFLETKLAAMGLYESECRPAPHPRSREVLRATAAHWGSAVGLAAAEPFALIREIR